MYCKECGEKIDNKTKYCPSCGKSTGKQTSGKYEDMITLQQMACDDCNATFEFDAEKNILCCPFCGSKKLIVESDSVRIAKYTTDAEKEIKLEKEKNRHLENIFATKSSYLAMAGMFAAFILLAMVLTFHDYLENKSYENTNSSKVKSSYSSSEYVGMDVQSVVKELESEGFTNIKLVIEKPNIFQKNKLGEVKEVKANGSLLSKNSSYRDNGLIEVIYYDDKLPENNE